LYCIDGLLHGEKADRTSLIQPQSPDTSFSPIHTQEKGQNIQESVGH